MTPTKTWGVRYRDSDGRERRYSFGKIPGTAGRHKSMTPEEARIEAAAVLARVKRGENPAEERRDATAKIETVADLWAELESRYKRSVDRAQRGKGKPMFKPKTWQDYGYNYRNHIETKLGTRGVDNVSPRRIRLWHEQIVDESGPYAANRCLWLLSSLYSHCYPDGANPCKHPEVRKTLKPESQRQFRFRGNEERRFVGAIVEARASSEHPQSAVNAVEALLLMGTRVSETVELTWQDVDLNEGVIELRDAKTGDRTIYPSEAALGLFRRLAAEKADSVFVFPNRSGDGGVNRKTVYSACVAIAEAAGLSRKVTPHRLRHNFSTALAEKNVSLLIHQSATGHRDLASLSRYSNPRAEAVRAAVSEATHEMSEAIERAEEQLTDGAPAKVLDYPS